MISQVFSSQNNIQFYAYKLQNAFLLGVKHNIDFLVLTWQLSLKIALNWIFKV